MPEIQCPVCTLYLHIGMSLQDHLDTHPKEQVIKALVNITLVQQNNEIADLNGTLNNSNYTSTPISGSSSFSNIKSSIDNNRNNAYYVTTQTNTTTTTATSSAAVNNINPIYFRSTHQPTIAANDNTDDNDNTTEQHELPHTLYVPPLKRNNKSIFIVNASNSIIDRQYQCISPTSIYKPQERIILNSFPIPAVEQQNNNKLLHDLSISQSQNDRTKKIYENDQALSYQENDENEQIQHSNLHHQHQDIGDVEYNENDEQEENLTTINYRHQNQINNQNLYDDNNFLDQYIRNTNQLQKQQLLENQRKPSIGLQVISDIKLSPNGIFFNVNNNNNNNSGKISNSNHSDIVETIVGTESIIKNKNQTNAEEIFVKPFIDDGGLCKYLQTKNDKICQVKNLFYLIIY